MSGQVVGSELAGQLDAHVNALLAEVVALPTELLFWVPAPSVWSIMQILCHVDEFIPYWTNQAAEMVAHPSELWGRDHTDGARIEAVQRSTSRSPAEVVESIRSAAQRATATIHDLSAADLAVEANSRNPRWGRKPVSFVLDDLLIGHLEKHRMQIRRNIAEFEQRIG